jgi:hypothetical protein
MDYVYGLFGYSKNKEDKCATKIQARFKGHLFRKKQNSAIIIQKYYKRYNVLRLSEVYKDISTNEVKISHTGVEFCKGMEDEEDALDISYNKKFDDEEELEDMFRHKRRQLMKLHKKLLIVKHELRLLDYQTENRKLGKLKVF